MHIRRYKPCSGCGSHKIAIPLRNKAFIVVCARTRIIQSECSPFITRHSTADYIQLSRLYKQRRLAKKKKSKKINYDKLEEFKKSLTI
jgi:hypothetical protein